MANRWVNSRNNGRLYFLGLQNHWDGDCRYEIKRHLFLKRKVMTNQESIIESRETFTNRGPCIQSCGFSSYHVCVWELDQKEGWVLKNWCFELSCWRRLFRILWTARTSNQSILKEINPEYSLKGLMLKLKFQYFGHLLWRADSLEKTLMLGNT